ncbi:hypothetical protein Tco_0457940 [Tanacetum coccineum]
MIDYSLWEVIENGNEPPITKVVKGVETTIAPTTAEEKAQRSLEKAATTTTSLDAEQDKGNINKTQSKATLNEPSSLGTSSGSGPRRQETMGDIIAQTSGSLSARVISSDEASLGDQEDASKQERKIDDIDKDAEITLVHETQGSVDKVTLAQALASLKSAKVQEKSNVVEEPSESITTTPTLTTTTAATTITAVSTRPKAKGLVIHKEEQATTLTVSS